MIETKKNWIGVDEIEKLQEIVRTTKVINYCLANTDSGLTFSAAFSPTEHENIYQAVGTENFYNVIFDSNGQVKRFTLIEG